MQDDSEAPTYVSDAKAPEVDPKNYVLLNSGYKLPMVGFGTYGLKGEEGINAISTALQTGYRLLDTAQIYETEEFVKLGIERSGVSRQEIFVTTKLSKFNMNSEEQAYQACLESLQRLGMDSVDLLLIHWPGSGELPGESEEHQKLRLDAWRVLERLHSEGRTKNIGVSNYEVKHLNELLPQANVVPAVNQVEFHPFMYNKQKELLDFCKTHGIVFQGYSSLGGGEDNDSCLGNETVCSIAKKLGRTPAQILLRWVIQQGVPVIPRSIHAEHIQENFQLLDFNLSDQDMEQLTNIGQEGRRFKDDPTTVK